MPPISATYDAVGDAARILGADKSSGPTAEPERETTTFMYLDIYVYDDANMTRLENELEAHGVDLMAYFDALALVSRPGGLFSRKVEIVTTDDWSIWVARDGDILDVTLRVFSEVDA